MLPPSSELSSAIGAIVQAINQGGSLDRTRLSDSAPKDLANQLHAAMAYGTCVADGLTRGGGSGGTVRLTCERGNLGVRLTVGDGGLLTDLRIAPAPGEVCVP